jgi:hypothetical protein
MLADFLDLDITPPPLYTLLQHLTRPPVQRSARLSSLINKAIHAQANISKPTGPPPNLQNLHPTTSDPPSKRPAPQSVESLQAEVAALKAKI